MSSFVVSLLTWWVTPCNHTLVFSYCEVLLWLDLITVVLFFFPFSDDVPPFPNMWATWKQIWEDSLRGLAVKKDQIWFGTEVKPFLWNWGIQTAVQPSASGGWNPEWWQSALTSNFCHGFLLPDPTDHQLIRCLLGPRLTPETKPACSHDSNYYIRSPGFSCFEGCFCVCLRNYGRPVCKEGGKHYLG